MASDRCTFCKEGAKNIASLSLAMQCDPSFLDHLDFLRSFRSFGSLGIFLSVGINFNFGNLLYLLFVEGSFGI